MVGCSKRIFKAGTKSIFMAGHKERLQNEANLVASKVKNLFIEVAEPNLLRTLKEE